MSNWELFPSVIIKIHKAFVPRWTLWSYFCIYKYYYFLSSLYFMRNNYVYYFQKCHLHYKELWNIYDIPYNEEITSHSFETVRIVSITINFIWTFYRPDVRSMHLYWIRHFKLCWRYIRKTFMKLAAADVFHR